jgi:hypothetical protein
MPWRNHADGDGTIPPSRSMARRTGYPDRPDTVGDASASGTVK